MTLQELTKIYYALMVDFRHKPAEKLFKKLIKNLKIIS